MSRAYHNMVARDNAFFLARERMKEVEKQVWLQKKDNYNEILHPLPTFDSNQTKSVANLDDIIKKSSMPIRRHKNSMYVDDSYILIGRCRMYKGEFKLGLDTYRYVNYYSKDTLARQEASSYLLRGYMAASEWQNARIVLENLERDSIQPEVYPVYAVSRAEFYHRYEKWDKCLAALEPALKNIHLRDERSRAYFIAGQLQQQAGNDSMADVYYKKTIKLNPPYELFFNAQLARIQVTDLDNPKELAKARKKIDMMLVDEKNLEYKDKIYYDVGRFRQRQKDYKGALEAYNSSVQNAMDERGFTKAAAYLKMAELHYDEYQHYETSKEYYDSALAIWDTKHKRYREISLRQKMLSELVDQIVTIRTQDSLLHLASLDSVYLVSYLDSVVKKRKEDAERLAKEQEKMKAREQANQAILENQKQQANTGTGSRWYFSNATAITAGETEFFKRWGTRTLEDHWRRAKKTVLTENKETDDSVAVEEDTQRRKLSKEEKDAAEAQALRMEREMLYNDIPFDSADQAAAHTKIQDALYALGKVYEFKFNESDSALKAFNRLVIDYPKTEYKPEVLYFQYLIYKKQNNKAKMQEASAILHRDFLHTVYPHLIDNPDYLKEVADESEKAEREYRVAYSYYQVGYLKEADSILTQIVATYPEASIQDQIAFLKLVIFIRTHPDQATLWLGEIERFKTKYAESPLVDASEALETDITQRSEKDSEKELEKAPQENLEE
jgi:tetratricopeptide (TPR) repeat protein